MGKNLKTICSYGFVAVLSLGFLFSFGKPAKALDSSLGAYWDFNGSNVDKINSKTLGGSYYNASNPWGNSSPQQSYNVNGGGSTNAASGLGISVSNNWSVSWWQYFDNNSDGIEIKNSSGQQIFYVHGDHQNDGRWAVKPEIYSNSFTNESPSWSNSLVVNTDYGWNNYTAGWHLYTIVGTTNHLKYYVDGVKKWEADTTVAMNADTIDYVNLEANNWAGSSYLADDLAIWTRALDDTEVAAIYSNGDDLNSLSFTVNCAAGYENQGGVCVQINYSAVSLFYFDNPYVRSKNTTARIDYLYNQDVFTPYDYIEVNRYDSATSTSKTFVATSTIIDLSYGGLLGKHDGQSFFTVASTSTDSGPAYYGVKAHLAAYWDATTQQDVAATTTIEYIVVVDWQDQTIPTPEEIINGQFQATSTTNIFNLDTYSLACTEDEWASTSSMPITGWNVDRTVCRIKKWVLDIALTPAFWIQDKVKSAGRILGNTFPFGLVKQISKSWQDSAAQNLPSELTWLTPVDSNGDLFITMPAGLTGSGTSSKVVLFGDSIFKNGNAEVAAVFAHLRVISKYFLWFGFIWAVYRMGQNIYEELTE